MEPSPSQPGFPFTTLGTEPPSNTIHSLNEKVNSHGSGRAPRRDEDEHELVDLLEFEDPETKRLISEIELPSDEKNATLLDSINNLKMGARGTPISERDRAVLLFTFGVTKFMTPDEQAIYQELLESVDSPAQIRLAIADRYAITESRVSQLIVGVVAELHDGLSHRREDLYPVFP